MKGLVPYTVNVGGRLLDLGEPQVMGILNVTPDSFYASSRTFDERAIAARARQIADEGGTIIDVGAYSTRPGSSEVDEREEMTRLRRALLVVRSEVPDITVSIDTFRADVARMCVEEFGAAIINDVSGGDGDKRMFATVAQLGVPYILMHIAGTVDDMHSSAPLTSQTDSSVPYMQGFMSFLTERIDRLHDLGQKDIIIDPGFGFGKSAEQNWQLMAYLDSLKVWELPLLVGVSRKSMIYRLLDTDADGALNGTAVCNTIALLKGASILRVHDVKQAVEAVKIVKQTLSAI
jgi:dihydropteroate synthase